MSRFEPDNDCDQTDIEEMQKEIRAAYRSKGTKAELRAFLGYLDGMKRRRIIADKFMDVQTGEMCAVASYCAHKGVSSQRLEEIERESERQRDYEGTEEGGGWDGPTVAAGNKSGLPRLVAVDLAWNNDIVWRSVADGARLHTDARGLGHTYDLTVYRDMTPEERWLELRNYVARHCGESQIEGAA